MNAAGLRGLPLPRDRGIAVYISLRMVWPMRASAVFSSGGAAETVTLSVVVPSSSLRLTSTVLRASRTTCSCTRLRNPAAVTVRR
jgi:hypothetical protein